jgi:hypothetical protein
MSLYKEAQKVQFSDLINDTLHVEDESFDLDNKDLSSFIMDVQDEENEEESEDDLDENLELVEDDEDQEDLIIEDYEEPVVEIQGEVAVQENNEEPVVKEFKFKLPPVPGADTADDIIIVDDKKEEPKNEDPWDWRSSGGLKKFPEWLQTMLVNKIPRHNGVSTAGIERTLSFLMNLNKVISNAVRADLNNELDIDTVQGARDEILEGIKRLEERLKRLETGSAKKAEAQPELIVKEAQKITGVKGIMVTVPLLISRLARVCINGSVSGGKDIEEIFKKQVKQYDLTKREQAELLQLLEDMGYPIRRDRGIPVDEDIDITSSDNPEWAANYHA